MSFFEDGSDSLYSTETRQFLTKYFPMISKIKKQFELILSDFCYFLLLLEHDNYTITFTGDIEFEDEEEKKKGKKNIKKNIIENPFKNYSIVLLNIKESNHLINFNYKFMNTISHNSFTFIEFYTNVLYYHFNSENYIFKSFLNVLNINLNFLKPQLQKISSNIEKELTEKINKEIETFTSLQQLEVNENWFQQDIDEWKTAGDFNDLFSTSQRNIYKNWDYSYLKLAYDPMLLTKDREEDVENQFLREILCIPMYSGFRKKELIATPFLLSCLNNENTLEFSDLFKDLNKQIDEHSGSEFERIPNLSFFDIPVASKVITNNYKYIFNYKGKYNFLYSTYKLSDIKENNPLLEQYLAFFFSPYTYGHIYLDTEIKDLEKYIKKGEQPKAILRVQLCSLFEMFREPSDLHATTFYFNDEKPVYSQNRKDLIDFASFYFTLFRKIFSHYPTHPLLLASDPTIYYNLINQEVYTEYYSIKFPFNHSNNMNLDFPDLKISKTNQEFITKIQIEIKHYLERTNDANDEWDKTIEDYNTSSFYMLIQKLDSLILNNIGFQFINFNKEDFFPRILNTKRFLESRKDKWNLEYIITVWDEIEMLFNKLCIESVNKYESSLPIINILYSLLNFCLFCIEADNDDKRLEAQLYMLNKLTDKENFKNNAISIYYPYEILTLKKRKFLLPTYIPFLIRKEGLDYRIFKLDLIPQLHPKEIQFFLQAFPKMEIAFTNEYFVIHSENLDAFIEGNYLETVSNACSEYINDYAQSFRAGLKFFAPMDKLPYFYTKK